jgi:hypothetical protein
MEPQDHQSAGIEGDCIDMSKLEHLTLIFLFGELTGNSSLVIYESDADGDTDSAITFSYRATSADLKNASADQLGSESTSASLSLVAATFEDRMLVVEIDASELTDGYRYITPVIDDTASELLVSCVAIGKPRYAEDVPPSVIPTS